MLFSQGWISRKSHQGQQPAQGAMLLERKQGKQTHKQKQEMGIADLWHASKAVHWRFLLFHFFHSFRILVVYSNPVIQHDGRLRNPWGLDLPMPVYPQVNYMVLDLCFFDG